MAPAAEDLAPTLGERPPEPAAQPAPPQPAPQKPQAIPKPAPVPIPMPIPIPVPHHARAPVPTPTAQHTPPQHRPKPDASPTPLSAIETAMRSRKADHTPAHTATAKTAAHDSDASSSKPVGASRIGADFLRGVTAQQSSGKAKTPPGQTVGPAVRQALAGAIGRQLKRYWRVPQGVDTDQLVTYLAFDLNRDGTLDGPVRVLRQEGVNDNNRLQANLHKENAIRAVELAAKDGFGLPPEYYSAWKHIIQFRFDRNLSQ